MWTTYYWWESLQKYQQFIATLKATFTLKHVTTLSKEQDTRFLGKRLQLHDDNSISISLEPSYWETLQPNMATM